MVGVQPSVTTTEGDDEEALYRPIHGYKEFTAEVGKQVPCGQCHDDVEGLVGQELNGFSLCGITLSRANVDVELGQLIGLHAVDSEVQQVIALQDCCMRHWWSSQAVC